MTVAWPRMPADATSRTIALDALRHLLRAPAAAPVDRGLRAPADRRRPRAGGARRQGRLRLCLGGRAPLPGGVLALERLRRLPRRCQPACAEHPSRLRDPA